MMGTHITALETFKSWSPYWLPPSTTNSYPHYFCSGLTQIHTTCWLSLSYHLTRNTSTPLDNFSPSNGSQQLLLVIFLSNLTGLKFFKVPQWHAKTTLTPSVSDSDCPGCAAPPSHKTSSLMMHFSQHDPIIKQHMTLFENLHN